MKVYVVYKGSYSDRHVVGVCSTEELADRLVLLETDGWNTPYWEVYTVDEIPTCPPGLLPYSVTMDRHGGVEEIEREGVSKFRPDIDDYGQDNLMYFSAWAKDKAHAIKIANERRVQLIAMNIWLPHKVDKKALARYRGNNAEEIAQAEREAEYYFPTDGDDEDV